MPLIKRLNRKRFKTKQIKLSNNYFKSNVLMFSLAKIILWTFKSFYNVHVGQKRALLQIFTGSDTMILTFWTSKNFGWNYSTWNVKFQF